jgi:hypothetical protein
MIIEVNIHPKAKKRRALISDKGLELYLNSAPVDGKANQDLTESIARALKLARSKVRIKSGGKSRKKLIEIDLPAEEEKKTIERKIVVGWR